MLCTCEDEPPQPIIHHKKSKKWEEKQGIIKIIEYSWTLQKYKGLYQGNEFGSISFPSKWLNETISSSCVLQELNKRNCFDFEYQPYEKDILQINIKNNFHPYLSFVFKNEEWHEGYILQFSETYEVYKEGKVKF